MQKLSENQYGFSAVEAMLVIVILALIGVVGWLVYENQHKSNPTVSTTLSTSTKPATTTKATATPAQPANPYAGWKSFCSNAGGLCLNYPTDWQFANGNQSYEIDKIASPSGLVEILYTPQGNPVGPGVGTVSTVNVVNVSKAVAPGYEVVSLIKHMTQMASPNYAADIFLAPTSLTNINHQAYSAGLSYSSSYEPQFYMFNDSKLSSYSQLMEVTIPVNNRLVSQNMFSSFLAAENWINSNDVKTATKILESVSLKH